MKSRDGAYRADMEFKAIGGHTRPSRIMERVEIDHTTLDLILLDDESLVSIGRPNLTLLIDVYSHCIVGFNLSFFNQDTNLFVMHCSIAFRQKTILVQNIQ